MIHQFKSQTLVLFKGLLLQPKVFSTEPTQQLELTNRIDAFFRFPMRAFMHDTVFLALSDTRFNQ